MVYTESMGSTLFTTYLEWSWPLALADRPPWSWPLALADLVNSSTRRTTNFRCP
jgi:hypothetical protein